MCSKPTEWTEWGGGGHRESNGIKETTIYACI